MFDFGYDEKQEEQTVGMSPTFAACYEAESRKVIAVGNNLQNFSELARGSNDMERISTARLLPTSIGMPCTTGPCIPLKKWNCSTSWPSN